MPPCTFIHLHMQVPHLEIVFLPFLLNKTHISLPSLRKHAAAPRLHSHPSGPFPCSIPGLLPPRHLSYCTETLHCTGVLWKVHPRGGEGLCLLPLHSRRLPLSEIQCSRCCWWPPVPPGPDHFSADLSSSNRHHLHLCPSVFSGFWSRLGSGHTLTPPWMER